MRNVLYVSIGIVVLVGGGWLYATLGEGGPQDAAMGTVATSSEISGVVVDPDAIADVLPPPTGYVEYRNMLYGFSFYHAPEAQVKEYDEGGGAMTIVLENLEKVRGLQIFIVPYAEEKISEERFHTDVPSGVRANVEATTVGKLGIEAVTFTSYDETLGDTRELWFIYKGYLYEVTTFKGVAPWFEPIIRTWRFI